MTSLILTILPSMVILGLLIGFDKFREPKGMILYTFFLGVLLCFPAGILNSWLIWSKDNPDDLTFLAGLSEESLKFICLYFFVRDKIDFNEPMDAIVYGTLISLGFATYENLEYVFIYNEEFSSFEVAIIRSLTAIPLHALCGIIMGYFFGLYVFRGKKLLMIKSICLPIFFHGLYNFTLSFQPIFVVLLLIGLFFYAMKLHGEIRMEQKEKKFEEEKKYV